MATGTIAIDTRGTYAAPPIVMSVAPRLKFGTEVQDVNTTTGEAKWTVQAAVSYIPAPGMRPAAEVIEVTVTGGDPMSITPGTSVEFVDLKCGVSSPEKNDRGRISGGRLWFTASAVRAAKLHQAAPAA